MKALRDPAVQPDWPEIVRNSVEALRFGFVQITVHNGLVVQIERTERVRMEPTPVGADSDRPKKRTATQQQQFSKSTGLPEVP